MFRRLLACLLLTLLSGFARADIVVVDDAGRSVRLAQRARRIVSLAPSIVENLYAAGAGPYIVGATDFSDYPEAAKQLPRLGDFARLDLEAIVALKPDLVIAWASGNPAAYLSKLMNLGLPVYISEPRNIADIAANIERFGQLAGTSEVAHAAALKLTARAAALRQRHAGQAPVRVFYQLWNQPLATVGGKHMISDVMRMCGAQNVFAELAQLAPTVNIEAVLGADPEAIVASGMDAARPEWLDMWQHWPSLTARARGNLFFVPPDLINRAGPRLLDGAELLCQHMETARQRRPRPGSPQAGSR